MRRKNRTFRKKVKKMRGGEERFSYPPIKRTNLEVGKEYFKKIGENGGDGPENFKSAGTYKGGEFIEDGVQYAKFELADGTEEKYNFDEICNDDTLPYGTSSDNYLNTCRIRGTQILFFRKLYI